MNGVEARLESAARKLKLALDMFSAGEELMRQRLRREYPDAPAREIDRQLVDWLRARPGAEFGDSAGTPVAWPRRQP
jgi:hypothetical protein